MYLKFLPIFLISLGTYSVASAQTEPATNKTPDNKNTTTTIVITEENSSTYFPKNRGTQDQKNAIKINPLLILNGDIPVYYEHSLSEKTSLEIGAGITIQNFIREFVDELGDDEGLNGLSNTTREAGTGYSLMASLRYYPADNSYAMEGFYFAPEIRHRLYNSKIIQINEADLVTPKKLQTSLTDFKVSFGNMDYIDDNIFIDYYVGAGLRKLSTDRVKIEEQYINGSPDYVTSVYYSTENRNKPVFSLGFKIGFAF